MKSQIFKKLVPNDTFFEFINSITFIENKSFVLSEIAFNKAKFFSLINAFFDILKEYYHDSKSHYILRKLTYVRFLTVIRQICNANKIVYSTKILYSNSTYSITYYIEKPENQ